MGESTGIAWTDGTFNPWWGCVEVSPACDNCYARTWDARFSGVSAKGIDQGPVHWGKDSPRKFFADKHWNEPLKWARAAEVSGKRFLVFCASMADVFESGRDDLDVHRSRLWDLIRGTPALTWLLLTKRPQNIARMLPDDLKGAPNIWLGTTLESAAYSWRAQTLAALKSSWVRPPVVTFLSMEPLLEPLCPDLVGIDWVITGGESGTGARPLNIDWVRMLRDECTNRGRPFLFKQADEGLDGVTVGDGSFTKRDVRKGDDGIGRVHRIVEKPYLDGVQWMQFPEGARP